MLSLAGDVEIEYGTFADLPSARGWAEVVDWRVSALSGVCACVQRR